MSVRKAAVVTAVGAGVQQLTEGGDFVDNLQENAILGVIDYATDALISDQAQMIENLIPGGIANAQIVEGYDLGKGLVNGVLATGTQRLLDMEGAYDDGSITGFMTQSLYNGAVCMAGTFINDQF